MYRVLVIEDSLTQAEMYREMLEEAGLQVEIAQDGHIGLKMAHELLPDLIVLDINLPIFNGLQICTRLKRHALTANIPIIMLTQRDRVQDARAGLSAGAIDYVAKDQFAMDTLLSSLRQLGMIK